MKLTLATCQFPVDRDINRNLRSVLRQMAQAKQRGAHVAHFSEVCMSGYAGVEFKSYKRFDWKLLDQAIEQVLAEARRLQRWTMQIEGSTTVMGAGA